MDRIGKGNLDLAGWLRFQIQVFNDAVEYSGGIVKNVLLKKEIWGLAKKKNINSGQEKILNKLLN